MAADEGAVADTPAGGPLGISWLFWGIGVGGVVLFIWWQRRKGSTGTGAITGPVSGVTTQTAGGAVDPYTGNLIDPWTGLPYTQTSGTSGSGLDTWISNAEKALVKAGYAPALVASAIYNYTSGNNLSNREAGAINRALGLVGFPDVALPFYGALPARHSTDEGHPPVKVPTGSGNGRKLTPLASLPAGLKLQPGERIVDTLRAPKYGSGAGYYVSNLGGIFAVGGAPFAGSYLGLKPSQRQGTRSFGDNALSLLPSGGYVLKSSRGETYTFPLKKAS